MNRRKWCNRDFFTWGSNKPISTTVTPGIKYGKLYNWYAASDPKFAPAGWHVPTKAEFETLLNEIDTYDPINDNWPLAGGLLKEIGITYWDNSNIATNDYLFNCRGNGERGINGFNSLTNVGELWIDDVGIYLLYLTSGNTNAYISDTNAYYGAACRLIKDDSTNPGSLTDIDGNVYRTCKIGNQVWLADNWACTKLNDGTPIPNVTDDNAWAALTTMGRCAYGNDESNVFI